MNKQKSIIVLILGLLTFLTSCEITRDSISIRRKAITKTKNPGFNGFNPNYVLPSSNAKSYTFLNTPPAPINSNSFNPSQVALPNKITLGRNNSTEENLIDEIPPTGFSSSQNNSRTHIVRKNESFWSIAKRYKISYIDLMVANGANAKTILQIGIKIAIPNGNNQALPIRQISRNNSSRKYIALPKNGKYIVQENDNLWVIARKFGLKVDNIKRWNNLSNNTIYPKMVLIFKNNSSFSRSKPTKKPTTTPNKISRKTPIRNNSINQLNKNKYDFLDHDIEKDDNLSELSSMYGTTQQLIKHFNNIKTNKDLHTKKTIQIPIPKQ